MSDNYTPQIALLDSEKNFIKMVVFVHLPLAKTYIFGSRVKGKAKKYSDIDIALHNTEKIPAETIEEIKTLLEKRFPYFVDLIDLQNVSEEFRLKISQEMKEI